MNGNYIKWFSFSSFLFIAIAFSNGFNASHTLFNWDNALVEPENLHHYNSNLENSSNNLNSNQENSSRSAWDKQLLRFTLLKTTYNYFNSKKNILPWVESFNTKKINVQLKFLNRSGDLLPIKSVIFGLSKIILLV